MYNLFEIFDDYHKDLLKKYNIEIKNKNINEEDYTKFLSQTNKMSIEDMEDIYDYLDDYFKEYNKKITYKLSDEEEKKFISHFNKDVELLLKNGKIINGHCDTFTRKEDSDYFEPELTIATSEGYIIVLYHEVEKILDK